MLDAREIRVFGGGRYELHTRDGAMLPVSRSRYNEIRTRMESGMIQTEQLDRIPFPDALYRPGVQAADHRLPKHGDARRFSMKKEKRSSKSRRKKGTGKK